MEDNPNQIPNPGLDAKIPGVDAGHSELSYSVVRNERKNLIEKPQIPQAPKVPKA